MADFDFTAQPNTQSCRLIDFEKAEVVPGILNGTFFLVVSGTKPCLNMQVTLSPLVYIQCPEYWEIEVTGCLPGGICLPAISPYNESILLSGITGSIGIEVVGANKRQKFKVAGGCKGAVVK